MQKPILVGAVIYDPKVAVIWDIIKDFFNTEGCPIDCVFYSNYELMVDALLAGHIQIAWNSPLAWVDAQLRTQNGCRAIAMRDTDRDRVTHLLVSQDSGIKSVADLRVKRWQPGLRTHPRPPCYLCTCCINPVWRQTKISPYAVLMCWSASTATMSAASWKPEEFATGRE